MLTTPFQLPGGTSESLMSHRAHLNGFPVPREAVFDAIHCRGAR